MRVNLLTAAAFVLVFGFVSRPLCAAEDWKPAAGPLMTRWAKDVKADKPLSEYPRPQMVRKDWVNLNGLWDYAFAAKDEAQPKAWQGKILVPFPVESALSGVMKRVGAANRLWYRRELDVAKPAGGGRVLLHFGAVDWETTVWLNGKELGQHRGGYDPFSFDVTDAIKDNGNELIVSVWDPTNDGQQPRGKQVKNPGGIFYTPVTGVWQTVWMETVPTSYVRGLKVTPDVDKSEIEVRVDLVGGSNVPDGNFFQYSIQQDGKEIAQASGPSGIVRIKVPNAKLWTPNSPHLYDLVVTANRDSVRSYFGLRKIEVKKDEKGVNRIYLNNEPIFMVGSLDQGFWPDGIYTAPTDEALKYDIEITKQLGFNATRKHVKVEPARWYYWTDKLGLLVWQDMPGGDNGMIRARRGEPATDKSDNEAAMKDYDAELKAMIDAFRNHPSIVMWVVFNEGWGQHDTVRHTKWVMDYDPSRLVNPASGWHDHPAGHVVDMHKYPAPGAPRPQENRAGVLGEFGGLGLPVPGHMWTDRNWGYKGVKDGEALTKQYVKFLVDAWKLRETAGLNAAIYTQITDVETEANGLLSYDREVIKVDVARVAEANQGKATAPPEEPRKVVLATSEKEGQSWRYTMEKPADNWFKPEFDDSSWQQGPGGFGTENTPGAEVRTRWGTPNIWIRREFNVEALPKAPMLVMHHDEDAEVYINGILAAKLAGYIANYDEFEMSPESRAALKPGKNTIAVSCRQTGGGQYIDVGIVDTK